MQKIGFAEKCVQETLISAGILLLKGEGYYLLKRLDRGEIVED